MMPTLTKRTNAFTLIEVMVAVALLGIVLLTAVPNFKSSAASPHGAALALAAAFTEARQEAIAQQMPVAVVIPSGEGTQGQADSYYIASGDVPRVTQVRHLGTEHPGVRLMVGHWPLEISKLQDPTLTTTISPPPGAKWESSFQLKRWAPPNTKDFAFIFTPKGDLVGNDLPHFDGAYHVIVSNGGSSVPAGAPGVGVLDSPPPLFSPTTVGSAYTVNLGISGAVWVSPGVTGATSSLVQNDAAVTIPAPAPPTVDPDPGQEPVVTEVALLPDPETLNLPPDVDMLLAPDRYMTITVRAKSPAKVPLFCQWTAEDGGLSSADPVRMVYLPDSGEWEGLWQWQPPVGATAGQRFTLKGKVLDASGNEASVRLLSSVDDPVIQIGDNTSRFAFRTNRDGNGEIYLMNVDGSGQINITNNGGDDFMPVWSADGNRLAFGSSRDGNNEVYVMNADGSGQRNLSNHPAIDSTPVWAPDGSQLAYYSDRAGNADVYVARIDGTGLSNLTGSTGQNFAQAWSPDGKQILFNTSRDGDSEIYVVDADGTDLNNLTDDPGGDFFPLWSPTGAQIAFLSARDMLFEIYVMDANGSNQRRLTTSLGGNFDAVWSPPTGAKLAFRSLRDGNNEIYVADANGLGLMNLTNHPAGDEDPVWSPTGDRIAFASDRDGDLDIFIMNADGTGQKNLTQSLGRDSDHAWR